MADVAQLGIQVKSEGADRAIAELRQLEQVGARAGAMANALQGQTNAAARGLNEMERAATGANAALGRMIGLGVTGALTTLGYGLMRAKNQILELAKVAEDNRLRPEFVSGLLGAARGAGASEGEITSALSKFSEVSKKAKDDAESFYKAMSNISPSLATAFQNAGSQEERLRLVSEAIRNTTDEVKRLQLAQEAFGTDTERVLRVLGMGRDALSEYERAARAMGQAVDQDMIAKARQADHVLAQLSNVVSANLRAALVEIAPVIANVAAQLGPLATEALRIISVLTGAQGLAATSTLRVRQSGGASQIASLEAEAAQLADDRRYSATQRVDAIHREIASIRRTMREVDAELANRGEFADPRDRRNAASEAFRRSGGLAGTPGAFQPRPSLTGGGASNDNEKESAAARALRQLEEQTKLQEATLQTLGLETAERERIIALQRAMNVANRGGVTLTDEQRQKIEDAAAAYGRMAARIEQVKKLQQQLVELNTFARDTVKGLVTDFTSNLAQGANAWQAFSDAALKALQRIADKLIQMALDNLWMQAFGGGGGLFSGLLGLGGGGGGGLTGTAILANGGVMAGGRLQAFAQGGVVNRPTLFPMANGAGLMGESGPEGILPLRRNSRGQLGVMAGGSGGGNVVHFAPITNITVNGDASKEMLAAMNAELDKRDQKLRQEMPAVMARARRDGIAA